MQTVHGQYFLNQIQIIHSQVRVQMIFKFVSTVSYMMNNNTVHMSLKKASQCRFPIIKFVIFY